MAEMLLRQVPDALAAGVASGRYQVYGSIIREVATGRVLGHLQEAGGLGRIVEFAFSQTSAGRAFQLGRTGYRLVDHALSAARDQRVAAGLEMLQRLQIGGLALGAAGIGVSILGFAVLGGKIDRVRDEVAALGDKFDRLAEQVERLGREPIERDLDDLRTMAKRMDEGWTLAADGSAARRWESVADDADKLQPYFARRAREVLGAGSDRFAMADAMLDAYALALNLRVAARAASGEERAARAVAAEGARELDAMTGRIGLADLALALVKERGIVPGTPEWTDALDRAADLLRPAADRLREREAAAATRGATLAELDRRGVRARDWMEAAREEADAPVLLLPAEG